MEPCCAICGVSSPLFIMLTPNHPAPGVHLFPAEAMIAKSLFILIKLIVRVRGSGVWLADVRNWSQVAL